MKAGALRRFMLAGAIAAVACAAPAQSKAAPGRLDPTFGDRGKVITAFGETVAGVADVARQPDGKLVAAGSAHGGFALGRYLPDGSLDTGFGAGGTTVTTGFPGQDVARAGAVAIQPDGKVVAAGKVQQDSTGHTSFALARYLPDGSLDRTFGMEGRVVTGRADARTLEANALAVAPDGKLIVAGTSYLDDVNGDDFVVARYLPNGALDPTFGAAGMVFQDLEDSQDAAAAIVLRPDGTIVAVGRAVPKDQERAVRGLLVAYRPDGTLDERFADGGISAPGLGGLVNDATVDAAGRIVVAGTNIGWPGYEVRDFFVARFQPDGWLDRSFSHGRTSIDLGGSDLAEAVAVRPDGSILAAGSSDDPTNPDDAKKFVLVRFNPDGSVDRHFGRDGKVETVVGGKWSEAAALVVQPDGKAVAAGSTGDSLSEECCSSFALARYDVGR